MYKKRTQQDYIDRLAKEFDIPKKQVKAILGFANGNIVKSIYKGREIRLKYIGNITFNKENYIKQLVKFKEKKDGK